MKGRFDPFTFGAILAFLGLVVFVLFRKIGVFEKVHPQIFGAFAIVLVIIVYYLVSKQKKRNKKT
ncbi:MAG: hypothetical protein ACE5HW_02250 [Candidatus Methanofastidiosia archaeon]